MSAQANISSAQQQSNTPAVNMQARKNSASDISVTTRIEYNLRFTKQAVLVVADNNEQYSQLAREFLVNLSNPHQESSSNQINVAFVSASSKLNDIQIRCRLIEQLFVNTLFDPEESLAVSVLRFAKVNQGVISIVVDHAHALSLQLKYELSQLVNFAKKNKLTINVVLFGLTKAANQLSENKTLFKNKMAVIDAVSGQVLSLDDKKFSQVKINTSLSYWQKIILLTVSLILLAILVWGYQLIAESIPSQAQLDADNSHTRLITKTSGTVKNTAPPTRAMQKKEKVTSSAASGVEIKNAILAMKSAEHDVEAPANRSDVLKALDLTVYEGESSLKADSQANINTTADKSENPPQLVTVQDNTGGSGKQGAAIDNNYYQNQSIVHEQGYVIQIAGFSDRKRLLIFIEQQPNETLYSYQRLLNGKSYFVVTSKVYANKLAAKNALLVMSENLSERKPWLKDISSLIKEINTFKG